MRAIGKPPAIAAPPTTVKPRTWLAFHLTRARETVSRPEEGADVDVPLVRDVLIRLAVPGFHQTRTQRLVLFLGQPRAGLPQPVAKAPTTRHRGRTAGATERSARVNPGAQQQAECSRIADCRVA